MGEKGRKDERSIYKMVGNRGNMRKSNNKCNILELWKQHKSRVKYY